MKKRTKKGFTLIELIVVITILAVLAIIAIPVVTGWVDKANESAAIANGRTLELAVKATMTDEGVSNTSELVTPETQILQNFGLTEDKLTNDSKYSLVVASNGAVTAVVISAGGIVFE